MSSTNSKIYIAGSDFFQEEEQKKILEQLEDCEVETFSQEDFSQEFFFNFINTPSLFQETKAAVVKSAHKVKGIGGVISKCKDCMESTLIFSSSETKLTKEISSALKEAGFETLAEKKARKFDLTARIIQIVFRCRF